MAFNATIEVDSKTYKLRHCSYSIHQSTDETGRPMSDVVGGTIQFETESSEDTAFFKWMIDPIAKKSGKIVFSRRNEDGSLKEIEFEDAHLVGYTEAMDALSNSPMVENVVISAKKMTIGSDVHENVWEF